MFRMYGRNVEILKYQISYKETVLNEQWEESQEDRVDYAVAEEEANEIAGRVNGTVTALPAGDDAWMDGMEVADVPDTYGEAVRVYEAGEAAWHAAQDRPTGEERLTALEAAIERGLSL